MSKEVEGHSMEENIEDLYARGKRRKRYEEIVEKVASLLQEAKEKVKEEPKEKVKEEPKEKVKEEVKEKHLRALGLVISGIDIEEIEGMGGLPLDQIKRRIKRGLDSTIRNYNIENHYIPLSLSGAFVSLFLGGIITFLGYPVLTIPFWFILVFTILNYYRYKIEKQENKNYLQDRD